MARRYVKERSADRLLMRNEKCWYKDVCKRADFGCSNCIRYLEMSYLVENSGIPENQQKPISLRCDAVDKKAFENLFEIKNDILRFVENGNNLYITSENTGNGKTSWARKILLKYFDCVWAGNGFCVRGYFAHVPTLLNILKDFKTDRTWLQTCLYSDLVVWDDIASTKLSDYDATQLLSIIDSRINQGKSNIYTGNITTKKELEEVLGARLASRIWSSVIIELKGKDRR